MSNPTLNFIPQDRRGELQTKTKELIQLETAHVWADRARAAYQLFLETGQRQWLLDGEEYYHEAVEHGAMAGVALGVVAALTQIRTYALNK